MLPRSCDCLRKNIQIYTTQIRNINNSEIATALRPFYFAVHPDLFGQYPEERRINEESLKHLSAHLESIQKRQLHTTTKVLQFYIRETEKRDSFKIINILLERNQDTKNLIQQILKSCNLSTDFVDKIKNTPKIELRDLSELYKSAKHNSDYNYGSNFTNFENEFRGAAKMEEKTLKSWWQNNIETARERDKELDDLKLEVEKLQESLSKRLSIEVRYECGWNYEHFRGCMKTLERLADMHEKDVQILKGRIVIFASFTGISLEGHVMLFTGDVLRNWLDFLKNIPKHDVFLTKVPFYENTLSKVLLNIKIRRRKFMPKQQVTEYASHLNKVTTNLLDFLSYNKFPNSWPDDLNSYEIVIESEAGPLMISPTGQIITPANIPGFMLVDFITNNLDEAKVKAEQYQRNKYVERELHKRCIDELMLKSLSKDDSVTPEKMIETLQRLLNCPLPNTSNINLNITNYYSVLTDGTICIPWDFIAE